MNKILLTTLYITFLITLATSCVNKDNKYFYHVLLVEYSKNANLEEITEEVLLFKKIPSVVDIEFGKIEKLERNKIQNFQYCLVLKFKNKKGLENYLLDPYHVKIYNKHKSKIVAIYTADFNTISLKE